MEGYGPYKPVPPPKPLQVQHQQQQQFGGCLTPPPYRMPPYPLYNEPNIPGAATTPGLDGTTTNGITSPLAASSPAAVGGQQGLQTHSSKFPVRKGNIHLFLVWSFFVRYRVRYWKQMETAAFIIILDS